MKAELDVGVVETCEGFLLLEKEWDDLYRFAQGVTPFQSWAWMYSWWESYGAGYELRIITLRDDLDLLVGLVPLMLDRRGRVGRLLFIGTRRNDYQDVLVREGWEDEVTDRVPSALGRLRGWHLADLHQLRPGSAAWSICRQWRGPRAWIGNEGSPVIEAKPWEELIASLSKNQRSTVRRAIRRAEENGLHAVRVNPEDATRAARTLVALHRELWQGRNLNREHATQRWATFIEAAAHRTLASGLGEISEFRRDGEVLLTLFWLVDSGFVGFYHSGVSQETLARYQWNALLIKEGIELARNHGAVRLDLLRGEQKYKMQWASSVIPNRRAILGRGFVVWAPYAGYFSSRSRLEQYVFSPRCPPWLRQAARSVNRAVTKVLHHR